MAVIHDPFRRRIDYLRLSVTDRCNLRCRYCLPEGYSAFSPKEDVLVDDEVVFLARCFAELGFAKLRVTGGEPLVRPGLPALIARLAQIPGVEDVALSTNGVLLEPVAGELARAGLKRVNISLDTLEETRFREITRFGELSAVLSGVERALSAGLSPIKLNVVVVRGENEGEIPAFVKLTESLPVHVRFIELMPMGETGFFSAERLVPAAEILERGSPLEPLNPEDWPRGHGPARYWKRPGSRGTVGVISAMSCNFCAACNRVRLSAKGVLVPCLDGEDGTDLRAPVRAFAGSAGAGAEEIKEMIRGVIARKPERHFMLERAQARSENPRFMCQIGG